MSFHERFARLNVVEDLVGKTTCAGVPSKNAGPLLEPANVPHNLINILGGHTLDLRHIAELPMVRTNAVGSRHLKRRIAVMVRLVDFVDQRRAVIGSGSSLAMTYRAMSVELGFTRLKLRGNGSFAHCLFRW